MVGDVIALMDHLKIARADVMGYSLGARMTAWLGLNAPQRLRSAILGGIGIGMIEGGGPGENVAVALEAPSLEDVTDPVGRTFRAFADQTRSDRLALAACLRGSRGLMTREEAARISVPMLIAVGTTDEVAGSAAALGKIIAGLGSARHPEPRPHARGRRQGLQDRRAGFSLTARVTRKILVKCWCSCSWPDPGRRSSSSSPRYRAAAISTVKVAIHTMRAP